MNAIQPNPASYGGNIPDAIAGRYDFKIMDIIREAWQKVKGTKASFWGAAIPVAIFSLILYFLFYVVGDFIFHPQKKDLLEIPMQILSGIILLPMYMGITMIGIHRAANLPFSAGFIFHYFRFFFKLAIGLLIYYLVYFASLALLIFFTALVLFFYQSGHLTFFTVFFEIFFGLLTVLFAGAILYLFMGYLLFLPMIVEKNMAPWQAFKTALKSFWHRFFKIFGLYVLIFFIVIISALPMGIGLIWSAPLANITTGVLYRKMFGIQKTEDRRQTTEKIGVLT